MVVIALGAGVAIGYTLGVVCVAMMMKESRKIDEEVTKGELRRKDEEIRALRERCNRYEQGNRDYLTDMREEVTYGDF